MDKLFQYVVSNQNVLGKLCDLKYDYSTKHVVSLYQGVILPLNLGKNNIILTNQFSNNYLLCSSKKKGQFFKNFKTSGADSTCISSITACINVHRAQHKDIEHRMPKYIQRIVGIRTELSCKCTHSLLNTWPGTLKDNQLHY